MFKVFEDLEISAHLEIESYLDVRIKERVGLDCRWGGR